MNKKVIKNKYKVITKKIFKKGKVKAKKRIKQLSDIKDLFSQDFDIDYTFDQDDLPK